MINLYYIKYNHPNFYIFNSVNKEIGKGLVVEKLIFGKTYLRVDMDSGTSFKCFFPNLFGSKMKVLKNGNELLYFQLYQNGLYFYETQYLNHVIQYREVENSEHYEIFYDGVHVGNILYDEKISSHNKVNGVGTEINVLEEISLPTILFALLRKDYYGRMT